MPANVKFGLSAPPCILKAGTASTTPGPSGMKPTRVLHSDTSPQRARTLASAPLPIPSVRNLHRYRWSAATARRLEVRVESILSVVFCFGITVSVTLELSATNQ